MLKEIGDKIVFHLWKGVIPLYRGVSIITLYGLMIAMAWFGGLIGFYAVSTSWIVPMWVNPSDEIVLSITSQLTTSEATLNTLSADREKCNKTIHDSNAQKQALINLIRRFDRTISTQKQVWTPSALDLKTLTNQKLTDNVLLLHDSKTILELRKIIEQDLIAGLITKGDAQIQINQLDTFLTNTTDSRIAETLLSDSIRQHQMIDISTLAPLAQQMQMEYQVGELELLIKTSENEIKIDEDSIRILNAGIASAKTSPLFGAVNGDHPLSLAIIPYGGEIVKIGTPIYDCSIGMAICSKTGYVEKVFKNEQQFEHPILRVTERGYIVQLHTTSKAMSSKTLIIGHKPFGF